MSKEKQIEKNCNECLHFEACCKWTDFPKQIGFPTCRKFAPISGYRKQSECIGVEELASDLDATYPGRCEYPTKNCDSCPAKDYRDNKEIPCEAVLHAKRLIERWIKKENGCAEE